MTQRFLPPAAAIIAALLIGCAAKPTEPTKPPATEPPKLIGRIASVPADKRFVLIQTYDNNTVSSGTVLTTRGPDDRTANLLATGEALGAFAAADVQSGRVAVGDAVYSRHVPKPAEDAKPPAGQPPQPDPNIPAPAAKNPSGPPADTDLPID